MAAAPPTFPFLLAPARSASEIDYTSSVGAKIYIELTKGLESKIELEEGSLLRSLEDIMTHAIKAGWTQQGGNIIDIPTGQGQNTLNLLTQFSQLTACQRD